MHPPIGFKTAEPAYTDGIVDRFYRPLIAAGIAPVVMSIDSAGHCYDAVSYTHLTLPTSDLV